MIFILTTSTTVCRRALQRKSNADVTFTNAQSNGSLVIVHHIRRRVSIFRLGADCSYRVPKGSR